MSREVLTSLHLHKHTLSLIQYLPLSLPHSVCLSVSLAHPPTKPLSFIPSMMVCPLLIFRGQGRDVHPQLLVSQRQTQELRLDNQLRTSILLMVISMFRHIHTHTQTDGQVDGLFQSQFSFNSLTSESEWCDSIQISLPPLAEAQFHNGVQPPACVRSACMDGQEGKDGQRRTAE